MTSFSETRKYKLIKKVSDRLSDNDHQILIDYIVEKIGDNIPRTEKFIDGGKCHTDINLAFVSTNNLLKIEKFVDSLLEKYDSTT